MPFIRHDGVRIHYETVGSGPALLLHHPTAGSTEDWIESGYVEALGKDRQVILVDSRGHGQSDKPYDLAAYDVRLRASDVIAVLDELGIHQADYFGYSLGGWIAFEVGRQGTKSLSIVRDWRGTSICRKHAGVSEFDDAGSQPNVRKQHSRLVRRAARSLSGE